MNRIALTSVRGAPGVTTTAHLLAARLADGLLVEADLTGGVMAIRYGLGREPGLTTLAAANPPEPHGWRDHAQDAGGVPVLVGPDVPETAASLWRSAGDRLMAILERSDGTAVIDAGRLRRGIAAVERADLVLVLARPVAEQMVGVAHLLEKAERDGWSAPDVVLVGDGTYGAHDVEDALGCRVLGHLPSDPVAANQLVGGRSSGARLARSRLVRSVSGLADVLEASLTTRLVVPAS